MIAPASRRIVAGLALVFLGSTSALAADAQAFADRFKALAGLMPIMYGHWSDE